ncbi:MAG: hypothetical protein QXK04_07620 [Ignisphaera sp.]
MVIIISIVGYFVIVLLVPITVTETTPITTTVSSVVGEKIMLGDRINVITPFIYNEKNAYYIEDIGTVSNRWRIEGSYEIENYYLKLVGNNGCSIAINMAYALTPYRVYKVRLAITSLNNISKISLVTEKFKEIISVDIDSTWNVHTEMLGKPVVNQRSISLAGTNEIEFLFAYTLNALEIFLKRANIDGDWILLAQIKSSVLSMFKLYFALEACNSAIALKEFIVYEIAGTGIRDLRPIYDWSNGKYSPKSFLKDSEGCMLFFATAGFYAHQAHVLILRTRDLIHFEPVKTIVIKQPGYTGQGVMFRWIDGVIHGYLMDWTSSIPPYQGGLHRIIKVELDENFNVLKIDRVLLIDAPPGGSAGHYDIAIFRFNNTWYAITSSFTGGTILWTMSDPTIPTLTYLKTIFYSDHENPYISPVISPNNKVQFMLSLATTMGWHRIYILDTEFNPIIYYNMMHYRVWTAGTSFYLDPWYIFIHQDQIPERRFESGDLGPGAYIELYKLLTDYRYFIEE